MNSRRFTVGTSRASDRKIAHLGTAGDCCAAAFQSSPCRSWVKSGKLRMSKCCPLCPRKQTFDLRVNGTRLSLGSHRERLAPSRPATLLAARQRRRPDAENFGGEVSFLNLPLTSHHSITPSARASSVSSTVRPSALAFLKLITSSYLVGAWTGKSAGFSPLRMRSTYAAGRRN